MKQLKSSDALKATARGQLLGKYKTTVFAYLIMELIIGGCLSLAELQVNLNSASGLLLYYAVYFIVLLLSTVFIVGQNHLYLNIARNNAFATSDLWFSFRTCADRAIIAYLLILFKTIIYGIPFMIATTILIVTRNNYLSLLVSVTLIFWIIQATLISLDYSQVFYLILDYPEKSARELLADSKAIMKGHRGSYFYLLVSFLGIFFLSALTFGIAMLWIYPYFTATKTNYYLELLQNSEI